MGAWQQFVSLQNRTLGRENENLGWLLSPLRDKWFVVDKILSSGQGANNVHALSLELLRIKLSICLRITSSLKKQDLSDLFVTVPVVLQRLLLDPVSHAPILFCSLKSLNYTAVKSPLTLAIHLR